MDLQTTEWGGGAVDIAISLRPLHDFQSVKQSFELHALYKNVMFIYKTLQGN